MSKIGRLRQSCVWNYFQYDKDTDKSVCLVTNEKKKCGKEIKGMFASNLKKHLKNHHPNQFKELENAESESKMRKRSHASTSQTTLHQQIQTTQYYGKDSKRQEAITKKLAVFVGATNVPLSLVDREEFRALLSEMDKRYRAPHRKKLGQEIDKVYSKLKANISLVLENAQKVTICADIWSKSGLTASFLGITAHCFTHHDQKRHNITLALRRFPSPHTGDRVAELFHRIIEQWKIPGGKVFRVLTDNGSNMVAAFKIRLTESLELSLQQEILGDLGDDEDDLVLVVSDSEEMEVTEGHNELVGDPHSQSLFTETTEPAAELDCMEEAAANEVTNFNECEDDHDRAFIGVKRVSCFIHTLQLVVKVFDTSPAFKPTLQKAYSIVSKVNKSYKATERLIELAGKKLVKDCPTRWDSTFLLLSRLLEVKEHLEIVLEELEWDCLTALQWRQLKLLLDLLQPFAHQTNVASSEKTTSIAMTVPILKELSLHLEEVSFFISDTSNHNVIYF